MSLMLIGLALVMAIYLIGFWSTRVYPPARPFRYNPTPDVHIAEARQTMQHKTLASRLELTQIIAGCLTDAEAANALTDWVTSLWSPKPGRYARSQNAMTIVSRAANGERFSREEYVTILNDALMAVGIPSRLVTLRTRDCVWRPLASYYRGVEYFDRDHFKWVWLDAQYGVRVLQQHRPLNILEIKDAALQENILQLQPDVADIDIEHYLKQLEPFMDIVVAQPAGQHKKFALIPPQIQLAKKKWLLGQTLYDISCHSPVSFYASHPIKQLTRPSKPHPISLRSTTTRTYSG